jgi:hypothetical protein
MNLLHQSLTPERYTPPEVAEALHRLYPGGFFDYASCDLANRVMGAFGYFSKEDDTLSRSLTLGPDAGPMEAFCNPPGGKLGNQSLQRLFWNRLHAGYLAGEIRSLVFLCFNLNAGPALCPAMLRYPRVYTTIERTSPCVNASGRMRFLASKAELYRVIDEAMEDLEPGTYTKRGNALIKKRESVAAMPVAVPGTDLVQETSPTNPGVLVFLPPVETPYFSIQQFRQEFTQFGSYSPGSKYG